MSKQTGRQGPEDTNEIAFRVVQQIISGGTPSEGDDSAKVRAGRLGGLKGGAARKQVLSPERRSEIARQAAAKRWRKPQSEAS